MPTGVQRYQKLSHEATCSDGPHIRKNIPHIRKRMDHALGVLLAQHNEQGWEQAVYYLSHTMMGAKY